MTPPERTRSAPSSSWLVRPAEEVPAGEDLRVWLPAALTQHDRFAGDDAADAAARLSYVVVDEIVDGAVGLTVAPWPYADEEGRLRFLGDDHRLQVGVGKAELEQQLYEPGRLARIGDVFGAELRPEWRSGDIGDDEPWADGPDEVFQGVVYDLTQAARTVSKLAYYSAVAAVIPSAQAAADNLLELEQPLEAKAPKHRLPAPDEPQEPGEDRR